MHPDSFLWITLDSCRYDTFESAHAPAIKSIGAFHRAQAPGNFTYGSHAAMFVGFLPSDPARSEPYINSRNPKVPCS